MKFAQFEGALSKFEDGQLSYPCDIAKINPDHLRSFGTQYLSHMARLFPDAKRTTDKMPFNFIYLGLISVLLPNAAIIHCTRDPMDTCLSCYFQHFGDTQGLSFTNSLEDLGFYYRQYERIMDHWRTIAPVRMIEVPYENVVADQETMSRRLIEHVGLDWDDACLSFHENAHLVRTASQFQVRQPIYTSSVEKWRKYEQHLGPLQEALKRAS